MINLKTVVVSILLLQLSLTTSYAKVNDFSGAWCWSKNSTNHAFEIDIKKVSNMYKGNYGSVSQAGNKIDENNDAFRFKTSDKAVIRTKLTAGITRNTGIVQLTISDNRKIEWVILKIPEGEFYVPHKAVLYRC